MILPAILEQDRESFEISLNKVKDDFNYIHVDILDSSLVPEKSLPLKDIKIEEGIQYEFHLMVEKPSLYIQELEKLNPFRVIIHQESKEILNEYPLFIEKFNTFLGIDLDTNINKDLSKYFEGCLLMSVKMGKSGRLFDERVLKKIKEASSYFDLIEVDGGINKNNVVLCKSFGASIFAIHSGIYEGDLKKNIETLKTLVE